jgi:DNA polymerase I
MPLQYFKVQPSYATDTTTAARLVAAMVADAAGGRIAVDFETTPLPDEQQRHAELTRQLAVMKGKAKAGALPKSVLAAGKSAAGYAERAGLDPYRATVRLAALYGGGDRVAVIDMHRVDWEVLAPVWEAPIAIHNALFDMGFLALRGIEPAGVDCTLQAVRLLNGPHGTSLEAAAANYFGLTLDKTLQVSDWGAKHLTAGQVSYAGADAVVTWKLAEIVLPLLGERRPAYDIQVGAIPAVVRMQLRGILLDAKAHVGLITALKAERTRLEAVYAAACVEAGQPRTAVPDSAPAIQALLAELLEEQELAAWPRTPKSGKLSTKRADLVAGAAAYPLLQALVDIGHIETQLGTFGAGLAAQISPVTGRVHASYRIAGAVSGRSTCSKPNMQNIPDVQPVEGLPSFRTLFVAKPGYVLVDADWSSMELRAAAWVSGDEDMTGAFERGDDLHALTARTMLGLDEAGWSALPEEERKRFRKHAKPVNFCRLFGQGAAGLVTSAREQYGLILDLATAKAWIGAFAATYPVFTRWCREFSRACERSGRIPIGREGGRVHEVCWNPDGFRYTQSLNLPIQGACADAFMLALTWIDAALFEAGIEGGPVAAPHDEIVLEVPEAAAAQAGALLKAAMTEAFATTFPGAPLRDVVAVKTGRSWAETK